MSSLMKMSAVVQDVTIRASSEGVDQAAASAERLARAGEAVAASSETQSRSALSVKNAYERLQRQIDLNYRQQLLFEQGQRTLDRALQQTHISAEEHARSMALLQARYGATAAAVNDNVAPISRFQKATGLAAHDVQNLGFQLNDVAVSLASGQSFFTVMVQQGAQILPILSSAPGGIGGALAGIGRYLVSLVTPATVAATAIAAIGTLGLVGLMRYGDEIAVLERSLTGLGRSTPATAVGLSRIAEGAAAQAKVTTSAARETAAALASTGQIGISNFGGLIAISKRFADALSLDAAEANKQLAASFADPVKGADDLNGKLNFLSDATRSYIRDLAAQNDQTGAQRALLDALGPALASATANTTLLGQAWTYVAAAARGAAEAIATAISGGSMEQQLEAARKTVEYAKAQREKLGPLGFLAATEADVRRYEDNVADLQERIRRQGEQSGRETAAAVSRQASIVAGEVARSLDPLAKKYEELTQKRNQLAAGLRNPGDLANPQEVRDAYEAYGRAIASLTNEQGKLISSSDLLRQKDELAIAAKKATTDAEKASIAERQKSLDLVGEVISKEEAARRVAHAGAMERIKDAKAGGAAANDNFDNALQRSRDQVEELRLQAEQASKTTIEVYRLTEALRLRRAAQQAGRLDDKGVREDIDAQAEAYARQRIATEQAIEAQRRLQESVRELGGTITSFAEDVLTGDLQSALKSLGRDTLRNSLSALISGSGPLAGMAGLAPTDRSGTGGLLGLFTGNLKPLTDAVARGTAKGSAEGIETGFHRASSAANDNGGLLGGLGITSKELAGGLTAIAGLAGAYGSGMAAGSYAQAGIGGALSGGMAGLALASSGLIGGTLGSAAVLGPIGLIAGAGLAIFGQQQAQKQAKKEQRRQAYEAYREAQPQIAQLGSQMRGDPQGTIAQRFEEARASTQKLGDIAVVAGRRDEAIKLFEDLATYRARVIDEFKAGYGGMIAAFSDGTGPNSPFATARDSVKSLGDQLKVFVDDTKTVYGDSAPEVEQAREAVRAHALSVLDGAREMSVVATRLEEIRGASAGLQPVLTDLGAAADAAAAAINERTVAALARLKTSFEDDLGRRTNSALDKGYLNDAADLIKELASLRADAAALGTDQGLVTDYFQAQAQSIVDGAELTGDAFADLIRRFPALNGYVSEFAEKIDTAAKAAEIAARRLGYQDRLFAALNDTTTLEGQLAAFDRTALREREAEIKAGGEAILDLEAAQAAERFNIIRDFNQQAIDDQKRAVEEAQNFLASFTRNIREYLDGLRAGSDSPLSPQARLQAAQSQYAAQLALAQSGNRDALNGITRYADDLLDAAKGYYASSTGFQEIFAQIQSQLAALPNQVSAEQLIVNAIDASKTATVNAIDVMRNTLSAAVSSGSASQIASALSGYFASIDTSVDGLIDFGEMQSALRGMASESQLRDMFTRLDTDNSGSLSRLELIKNATTSTETYSFQQKALLDQINGLTNSQNTLMSSANSLSTTANSLSNYSNAVLNSQVSLLDQIRALNDTSAQTLNALNGQFSLNASLNIGGVGLQNNMVTALNKIVYNTAGTWSAVAKGAVPAAYAEGGWISGPGTGTSDSILLRGSNGEFMVNAEAARRHGALLEAINGGADVMRATPMMALPMPVPANSNSAGDTRAVVAMLGKLIERIGVLEAKLCAAEASGAERIVSAVDGAGAETRRAASDARQAASRPRTAGTR